jgi:hypothetical protein
MKAASRLVSASLIAAGLSQLALAGGGEAIPSLPSELAVPGGQKAGVKFNASGVQIYRCAPEPKVASDYGSTFEAPDHYVWTLVAPEATLLDESGKVAGRHYGGPTWEASDGSKVVGKVLAKTAAPDGASIPWLLMSATVVQPGDRLGRVAFVQRLHTNGGLAPASGCSRAVANTEVRVPYTADYYFYLVD